MRFLSLDSHHTEYGVAVREFSLLYVSNNIFFSSVFTDAVATVTMFSLHTITINPTASKTDRKKNEREKTTTNTITHNVFLSFSFSRVQATRTIDILSAFNRETVKRYYYDVKQLLCMSILKCIHTNVTWHDVRFCSCTGSRALFVSRSLSRMQWVQHNFKPNAKHMDVYGLKFMCHFLNSKEWNWLIFHGVAVDLMEQRKTFNFLKNNRFWPK